MATKKMDHSEVIERTMEEWSHIFNMVSKAYGIRVTSYKVIPRPYPHATCPNCHNWVAVF